MSNRILDHDQTLKSLEESEVIGRLLKGSWVIETSP